MLADLTTAMFGSQLIMDELKRIRFKVGSIHPDGPVLMPVDRLKIGPMVADDLAVIDLLLQLPIQIGIEAVGVDM